MTSILLPWVELIGLRQQGVLMSAMRGCDITIRHDPSKVAQRVLRASVLMPHAGRFSNPKTYIRQVKDAQEWWADVMPFCDSFDHYPNHYVWHFIHAAEVIGYLGPSEHPVWPQRWFAFYELMCDRMHVNPETMGQMQERLNRDEKTYQNRSM